MNTKSFSTKITTSFFIVIFLLSPTLLFSADRVVDASKLISRVSVSINPVSASFVEGSTFEVPILLDTRGVSINGVDVKINFDSSKLSIIKPSSGQSIIGVWVEPPSYDNTRGTASYVGVIPNGIVTKSGLIGTITFKAKATGRAVVTVRSNSSILLNDGVGTEAQVDLGRAEYSIIPKPPEGVVVYSETHPFSGDWYNNNSPVFSWDRDLGVSGFSYIIDTKPNTIPENTVLTSDTIKSYEKLSDGLWYFHIKAIKNGVWGTTGHFLVRIDTAPPAEFKPEANYLLAAPILAERALVSFFTTDNLSGIDHYEVGTIDKSQPLTESPVFIQSESPFQVPITVGGKLQVIVRAVDKAGNVRDESIDVRSQNAFSNFIKNYLVYILAGIILLGFVILVIHYTVGHHIIRHLKRMFQIIKKEEVEEILQKTNNIDKPDTENTRQD
jgi:hypothetical protein